jgi:hypothetical protein
MIVSNETAVHQSLPKRAGLLIAGIWRGLVWVGFLMIGLIAAMVGLQIPIVALVLTVLLIMGAVCRATVDGRGRPIAPLALVGVALFLGLAGASLAWTPDLEAAEHQLIQFAYTLVPMALAIGVISRLPAGQTKPCNGR